MSLPCTESGAESTLESCINTADRRASQFNADGYVVAEQVFSETVIDKALELALGNFREVNELISAKGFEFGIGIKYGFKEIVQRHPQRYEMPYKMDDPRFDFVLSSEPIRQMVSRILQCDDYIVANRSLVISNNGCVDQAWHTDGPHMSATTDLPCHCLNVFVPLVDVTSLNGPTEFRPGSQFYTRDLAKSMLIAKLKKQLRPVDAPEVKRGSVLLFDYRVLHRGTANRSDAMRPILVFTFAKPWYKDMLNFPHRSVFAPAERTFKAEADAPLPLAPAGKVVSAPPPPAREELQKQLDEAAATAASSVAEVNAVKCVVDAAELSAPVELASSPCSMPLL